MKKLLIVGLIGVALWYAQAQRDPSPPPESLAMHSDDLQAEREIAKAFSPEPRGNFSCDGRTRCAEMRSCDEAEFFLKNCPGVKMDGDGDGIPCEDQHCGH